MNRFEEYFDNKKELAQKEGDSLTLALIDAYKAALALNPSSHPGCSCGSCKKHQSLKNALDLVTEVAREENGS